MSDRRIDAFFYGLFMDSDILRESNVTPFIRDALMSTTSHCVLVSAPRFFL